MEYGAVDTLFRTACSVHLLMDMEADASSGTEWKQA